MRQCYQVSERHKRVLPAGFTIVELLIVIVVIAILAAIAIVAYVGVSDRAYNSRTLDNISKAQRALAAYHAVHDRYPSGGEDGVSGFCLGTGHADRRCARAQPDPSCGMGSNMTYTNESDSFADEMRQFSGGVFPANSHPEVMARWDLGGCSFNFWYTGAVYSTSHRVNVDESGRAVSMSYLGGVSLETAKAYHILYYIKGEDRDCGVGITANQSFVYTTAAGWTTCELTGGVKEVR